MLATFRHTSNLCISVHLHNVSQSHIGPTACSASYHISLPWQVFSLSIPTHMRHVGGQECGVNGARRAAHRVAGAIEDYVVAQQALEVDSVHKKHQYTPLLEVHWACGSSGHK